MLLLLFWRELWGFFLLELDGSCFFFVRLEVLECFMLSYAAFSMDCLVLIDSRTAGSSLCSSLAKMKYPLQLCQRMGSLDRTIRM
jgi:hypothetical protein